MPCLKIKKKVIIAGEMSKLSGFYLYGGSGGCRVQEVPPKDEREIYPASGIKIRKNFQILYD